MAQFPILNSHPKGPSIVHGNAMMEKIALSDQLEERLIDFAARIINLADRLPKALQARHWNQRRVARSDENWELGIEPLVRFPDPGHQTSGWDGSP